MQWNAADSDHPEWRRTTIANYEAKLKVARQRRSDCATATSWASAAGRPACWPCALWSIGRRPKDGSSRAITTSLEMTIACAELGVPTTSLLHERPDWSFDGADEVDGRAQHDQGSRRRHAPREADPRQFARALHPRRCVQASRKARQKFPVPIEVIPERCNSFDLELLESFDVREIELRMAMAKDGPVITENGNVILEVRFADVTPELDPSSTALPGVVGTGCSSAFAHTS